MELEEIVVVKSKEEKESFFPSLQMLAARQYSNHYKKLPDHSKKKIPEECIEYIKGYLPITGKTVIEQFVLAQEIGDNVRAQECCDFHQAHQPLTEESVFYQYGLSLKFKDEERKKECYEFIEKHFNGGFLDSKGHQDGYEKCINEMHSQLELYNPIDKMQEEKELLKQLKPKVQKARKERCKFVCLTLVCSLGLTSLLLGLGLTYLEKINDEYD